MKNVNRQNRAFQFLVGSARCADRDAAARRPYLVNRLKTEMRAKEFAK
jgi:hypothetical protein